MSIFSIFVFSAGVCRQTASAFNGVDVDATADCSTIDRGALERLTDRFWSLAFRIELTGRDLAVVDCDFFLP